MGQSIANKQDIGSKESLKQRLEQSGKLIKDEQDNLSAEENEVADERLLLKNRLKDTKKSRALVTDKTNSETLQSYNESVTKSNSRSKKYRSFVILLSIVLLLVSSLLIILFVRINYLDESYKTTVKEMQQSIDDVSKNCDSINIEFNKLKVEKNKKKRSNELYKKGYVDLGLPSGLLWATCNVGANRPEEFGDYLAWGEITTKSSYNLENYKWYNHTKYCSNNIESFSLASSDDAAKVRWGDEWRIPLCSEFEELIKYCNWEWTVLNGVKGNKATSRINGESIFFPATGVYIDYSRKSVNSYGSYWSSTTSILSDCNYAYALDCGGKVIVNNNKRHIGRTVRPVCAR